MRLHRFYKENINTDQLFDVFRMRVGDRFVSFDGSGMDQECEIEAREPFRFRVLSSAPSRYMPARKIYLCAAIVKKDNFEFIVEKATELGVTDVVPVLAERSEKKSLNEERLRKIAVEASEQSGRGDVPKMHQIKDLADVVADMQAEKVFMVAFHTERETMSAGKEKPIDLGPIALLIGPEGGWSPDEIDMFHKNKIQVRCLGSQVLRAETAVVAALSQVVFR